MADKIPLRQALHDGFQLLASPGLLHLEPRALRELVSPSPAQSLWHRRPSSPKRLTRGSPPDARDDVRDMAPGTGFFLTGREGKIANDEPPAHMAGG